MARSLRVAAIGNEVPELTGERQTLMQSQHWHRPTLM
jgi:hypothetical protein